MLRRAFWPLLAFEATFELAVLLAIDPVRLALLARLAALSGDPFVGNAALLPFLTTVPGMLALASVLLLSAWTGLLAFAGAALILWGAATGRPASLARVCRSLLAGLPHLLVLGVLLVAAALLLAAPVLAVLLALRHTLLSGGDLYFYLSTRPPVFLLAAALASLAAAGAAALALWALLRTALAVPAGLLRPHGSLAALRRSIAATRGRVRPMLRRLLATLCVLLLLWTGVLLLLGLALRRLLGDGGPASLWAGTGFAFAAALVVAALAAVTRAGFLLVVLRDPAALSVLAAVAEAVPATRRRWHVAAALLLAVAAFGIAAWAAVRSGASPDRPIAITAHRAGSARAPENTLAALRNAIAEGADVVEVDAQETADGAVVLLHDTDLRRVAGDPRFVWQLRLDELQRFDVGAWFAPEFRGERVPTLRDFAIAARGKVRLNVELKNNGHEQDLVAQVVSVLRETGTTDIAAISSLDLALLRQARLIAPEIKLGLILATGVGDLSRVDVDFLALARRLATPATIRTLAARGRAVHVWTLDTRSSLERAILDGADNVITGDTLLAAQVRAWFRGLNEPERLLLRAGSLPGAALLRLRAAGDADGRAAAAEQP